MKKIFDAIKELFASKYVKAIVVLAVTVLCLIGILILVIAL